MPKGMAAKRKQTANASLAKTITLPEDKANALNDLCEKYFWQELKQLEALFESTNNIPFTLVGMKTYVFTANAKKMGIELLKKIAISSKKPVKKEEIESIDSIIKAARKRVGDKGLSPHEAPVVQ